MDDQPNANLPNMLAIYRTVAALQAIQMHQQQSQKTATNTKTAMETNSNNEDNEHLLDEPDTANNNDHAYHLDEYDNSNIDYFDNEMIDHYQQEFNGNYDRNAANISDLDIRNPPKTLDLTMPISKKHKLSRKVFQSNKYENFNLNGIIEENDESEQILIDTKQNGNHSIKLISEMMSDQKSKLLNGNNGDEICAKNQKITEQKTGIVKNEEFLKRIEFFELNNQTNNDSSNTINDSKQSNENISNNTQLSTILCLSTFLLTFFVLFFFEIPS